MKYRTPGERAIWTGRRNYRVGMFEHFRVGFNQTGERIVGVCTPCNLDKLLIVVLRYDAVEQMNRWKIWRVGDGTTKQ